MKQDFFVFMREIDRLAPKDDDRGEVIKHAVAIAVALEQPVPNIPVSSPEQHLMDHIEAGVRVLLSDLNEGFVFDVTGALRYVRAYWLMRYAAANPGIMLGIPTQYPYSVFETILGIPSYISPDMAEMANKHKCCILELAAQLRSIIVKMKVENAPQS